LADNTTQITKLCQFTVFTDFIRPQIFVLDSRHVLLTNMSDVTISCPDRPQRNVSCQASCRVTLPCRCSLASPTIYLPARMERCMPWGVPTVLHSNNLAFLRNFFNESDLTELYGNTLMTDPMRVMTPRLKIFETNYSHELEADKRARFDLARLANLTKQDTQAFSSLAHSMVPDWQDIGSISDTTFSLWGWKSWCIVVIGLLAGISFGFSLILSYRLRILAATVSGLTLPGRGYAVPTALNYFTPTPRPINGTNVFLFDLPTDWTIDITAILLLVFIVLVVLIKGFRRHQKGLFLHVGIDTSACEIWVKTFKLEPALYTFSATNYIESLEVIGTLFPRLILTWPTLRINSDITNESYCLPKTVALTWKQASFLRRIFCGQDICWAIHVNLTNQGLAGCTRLYLKLTSIIVLAITWATSTDSHLALW